MNVLLILRTFERLDKPLVLLKNLSLYDAKMRTLVLLFIGLVRSTPRLMFSDRNCYFPRD